MTNKVAIVGRPNVGKSSLMNMLAGKRISIVDPTAGITRDRVNAEVEIPPMHRGDSPRYFELIDTGGYGVYSGDPEWHSLTDDVEEQIGFAVDEASLILFVVDAHEGVTPLDLDVARLLRRRVKEMSRVVLVANKVDSTKHEPQAMEVMSLGFGEPMMTSANSKRGRVELLELIGERLGEGAATQPEKSEMLLAIVGRRNAGKSTLVNTLAGGNRVIASEIPGTTRDSVDVRFTVRGHAFTAIDTAGVRKRKSMAEDVEYYSLHRALRSIRRADVVVLLIDATDPVSGLEKRLGSEIMEHHKPCIIAVNKWDLVKKEHNTGEFVRYLNEALNGLDFAPIVFISAKDNDGVEGIVKTARALYDQAGQRVPTAKLNETLQEILEQRGPSPRLGKQAKIYYVTMPSVFPPTIAIFVNHPDLFDQSYQRYILNQMRLRLPFEEVPIKLLVRGRTRATLTERDAKRAVANKANPAKQPYQAKRARPPKAPTRTKPGKKRGR